MGLNDILPTDTLLADLPAGADHEAMINTAANMAKHLFEWRPGTEECKIKINGSEFIEG